MAERLDADIKDIAKRIIQGNEKRKKRKKMNRASEFDVVALDVIEAALRGSCSNIANARTKKTTQDKVYKSIVYNTPYEYIGETYCGRRQFYDYRNDFIIAVATNLGMLPANN